MCRAYSRALYLVFSRSAGWQLPIADRFPLRYFLLSIKPLVLVITILVFSHPSSSYDD